MKKIILSCLLGFISLAYASTPLPPNSVTSPEVSESKIISSQNFFVTKNYDDNSIPQDLKKWIPWVNKNNFTQNCVESVCVFIPQLTIQKNSQKTNYTFLFNGTSLAQSAWVSLPYSDTIWPLSVRVNGQKALLVNHEGKPFIQVPQKDFKIEVDYTNTIFDKNSSFELPFNIVSFSNQTGQNISLKDTTLSLSDIAKTDEQNSFQEIKVFRKFTDNIPYQLDTNLQINFSGKTKEIDLGAVLPSHFKLTQINSDLKVIFKDNHYFATLVPGTHFINFKSFANKEISSFSVKDLVLNIDSEIWSVQNNNNIRNIDIKSATVVDPKQVSVPQEWVSLPSYMVSDKLDIISSQQGLSFNTDLKLNAQRTTIFGFNDTVYSLDRVSLTNQNSKELKFNSGVSLQSISLSQPKMILKEKDQNYILLNAADNTGTIQFDTPKGNDIVSQLADSYYVDSWNAGFIPRTDLIWATNAKVTSSDFWFNAWNLYSLFSLSVLIIALYKLVGKEAAVFALFSLVSFYYNNSVFWIFWILLVISYAFNKYLPEKYINFKRNTNNISLIGTFLVVLFSLEFVFNEIFSLMHANVSHRLYFSPMSSFILILVIFIAYKLFNKIVSRHSQTGKKKGGWLIWLVLGLVCLSLPYIFSVSRSTTVGAGASSSAFRSVDDYAVPAAAAPAAIPSSVEISADPENIKAVPSSAQQEAHSGLAGSIKQASSLDEIARRQEAEEKAKQEALNQSRMLAKPKANLVRDVAQEKVQVGHSFVEINSLHSYTLTPSNKDAVHFYIADKWLVNLYGIIQSIFLLLLAYILVIYNLFIFKKNTILEKLPSCLSNNYLVRKVQSKINEA